MYEEIIIREPPKRWVLEGLGWAWGLGFRAEDLGLGFRLNGRGLQDYTGVLRCTILQLHRNYDADIGILMLRGVGFEG